MSEGDESGREGLTVRLARWADERLGLSHQMLRPVPSYAINPFYWLGALAVVAFVIQGVTGILMMLYYVPSPDTAYSSTQYIFTTVNYGQFLETIHLYTAYAMIMLAFMHMMRGYFVSVHKKPREVMWVVGMLMGFVTLGFGFTGYLLPWTVVSKSATDVGVGLLSALPPPLNSFLTFLAVGGGSDATELLRFFDLHVVLLPAVLLVLLVVKMYMLEAHGVATPTASGTSERKWKLIPVFPDVTLYLVELAALFGVGMMVVSALFPLSLPPQYSPTAAAGYNQQPEWYFLWIYQILKFQVFEPGSAGSPLASFLGGSGGLALALSAVTIILLILVLLPFIDRGKEKAIGRRPVYTTLGIIFVVEIIILAYWGEVTPGQTIPNEQGLLILGGSALVISLFSAFVYRLVFRRVQLGASVAMTPVGRAQAWSGGLFALLVASGSLAIGGAINSLVGIGYGGITLSNATVLFGSLVILSVVVVGTVYLLYRLDLATGSIRRRIRRLEVGWESAE